MLSSPPKVQLGIFAFGNGGINTGHWLCRADRMREGVTVVVADTDKAKLKELSTQSEQTIKTLLLPVRGAEGFGTGYDPQIGAAAARAIKDSLLEEATKLRDKNGVAILLGFLGGGTSGALPVMANILKEVEVPTFAIVTTPFSDEGGGRMHRALKLRGELLELVPVITLHNQAYTEGDDERVSVLFESLNNQSLNPLLTSLGQIFGQTANVINIDRSDLLRVLRSGKYLYFGHHKKGGAENQDPQQIATVLLAHPYQDDNIVGGSANSIFWFDGMWTKGERSKIVMRVQEGMDGSRLDSIELKAGLHENSEPCWVGFLCAAEKPVERNLAQPPAVNKQPQADVVKRGPAQPPTVVKVLLNCKVGGEKAELSVKPEMRSAWIRGITVPSPEALRTIEELAEQILAETGKKPDLPANFKHLLPPPERENGRGAGFFRLRRTRTASS